MRARQHEGVYPLEPCDVARHRLAAYLRILPSLFHDGSEQRSCDSGNAMRRELGDLDRERARLNGSRGSDNADVSAGNLHGGLGGWNRHAEDASPSDAAGRVLVLKMTKSCARDRVTSHDDEPAALLK